MPCYKIANNYCIDMHFSLILTYGVKRFYLRSVTFGFYLWSTFLKQKIYSTKV